MKKFLAAVVFGLMAIAAQAEATFDQVQTLIQQHEYQAAASGLETIIQNHPKSAKAFYAMAQAQAGLGNLEKAQKALNIATGLNPTLDFAPASSVASLKQAITPQVAKIETIEESHFWRNTIMALILASAICGVFMLYIRKENEKTEAKEAEEYRKHEEAMEQVREKVAKAREQDLKTASSYVSPAPRPAYRGTTQTVAPTPAPAPSAPTHTTTVVNNSSNDMLTGVLIGNMLSGSHHDTTRVVEREVVREVPAPSRSSSWDDTPSKPSRSSSWDDDSSSSSSSSKSSSWDSSPSSSSSSSWDSSSSSSDSSSSSSSSWD